MSLTQKVRSGYSEVVLRVGAGFYCIGLYIGTFYCLNPFPLWHTKQPLKQDDSKILLTEDDLRLDKITKTYKQGSSDLFKIEYEGVIISDFHENKIRFVDDYADGTIDLIIEDDSISITVITDNYSKSMGSEMYTGIEVSQHPCAMQLRTILDDVNEHASDLLRSITWYAEQRRPR